MTLPEKIAQLVGFWVDQGSDIVAPMQGEMAASSRYEDATVHGIGHLTRVYGTRPVDPVERASWLWAEQRRLMRETRLGIPALVHEECLTGLAAWKAATFPTPLAWGASFDPSLVQTMAASIGDTMHQLGIHQGLAPVLDVIRDPRWGRVDECISEDPYVVGDIGTAYVRGLQSEGVHATLKHFTGYSGSQAGRNHAPNHAGLREVADVFLPPFEMAVKQGHVRSVMNSYAEIDGVPMAASVELLTNLLRDEWGFNGVVVADYFAVAFLHTMHRVAPSTAAAAELALAAGIDVELPSGDAYIELLAGDGEAAKRAEPFIDRAVLRVLAQKEELGLFDATFDAPPTEIEMDSPRHREIARSLAEESIILLSNNGILPLASAPGTIALIGPNMDDSSALMGCYSFANHVLAHHPGTPYGFSVPTVADALRAQFPSSNVVTASGCDVEGDDRSGFADAIAAARAAEVAIVAVGDRAGLFGRGTVGEGNDVATLNLPGVQRELVLELCATGTPVVLIMLTGRPYALDWALDAQAIPAAVLQSFFPGEEGASALAAIISGSSAPSGRLPVSMPRAAGAQPYYYLHPVLGGNSEVTSADSNPVRPFGFGLTYTTFEHRDLTVPAIAATHETLEASVQVTNTGERAGTDVVQLYTAQPYRSVTRPVAQLVAYERVHLEPGETVTVTFSVPPTRLAFSDRQYRRVVEPGAVEWWAGPSCEEKETTAELILSGAPYELTGDEPLFSCATVARAEVVVQG